MQDLFQLQKPLAFLLFQLFQRDLCPLGYHGCDLILRDEIVLCCHLLLIPLHCLRMLFDELLLLHTFLMRFYQIIKLQGAFDLYIQFIDLLLQPDTVFRYFQSLQTQRRCCLIDQVDRLIRQITVIDITV